MKILRRLHEGLNGLIHHCSWTWSGMHVLIECRFMIQKLQIVFCKDGYKVVESKKAIYGKESSVNII